MLKLKIKERPSAKPDSCVTGAPIISIVEHVTATETRSVHAEKIISAIKSGKWKKSIEEIRRLYAKEILRTEGTHKKAKLAVDPLKKKLPAILWSGRFSRRANDGLIEHSALLSADLDELGESRADVRAKLLTSPFLWALFRSPTGSGLKPIFRVPPDASKHLASFRAVEQHVLELTGIQIDQACKDIARLCFVSWDPDCHFNPDACEIKPLPEPEKPKAQTNSVINLSERQRVACELLGAVDWESEISGFVTCPGKHLHTTGDNERDCKVELENVPTVHCFHDHCRGIVDAVNRELRSRIGKAEFEARLQTVDVQFGGGPVDHEKRSDVTSLTSPGGNEYPASLDEAAFYGLAGDIVRRIEPHTEADRVALLIQMLVGFGNVIGRNVCAIADGSRHTTNMNVVLVGETSKGRKGTAWQHVLRLFEFADKQWTEHIANGLSSGEGIIWAVRDPIIKLVRQEDGSYADEVVDAGVADKRLCVLEGEFANVLKVMSREGNTLSPVIRSAWDTGNLRSLTKNSPARATDAHISIIGHITRKELRRLLTETESANGFANRFPFVAVKRSKCLPEGGGAVLIADLVERLKEAVEFAQTAGKLKRDDTARELWAGVYPKLSEGKPGLLGAITARAEAQVLRLSMIYALLDCSTTVEVEHLRAALALWRYCEDSARWIFETGTGNKNADRILAALRAAGERGLTKWQITADVFNKHAPKFEIDEALRLLHSLNLARCERESTPTRPAERWFYKAYPCEVCEESALGAGQSRDTSHFSHPPPPPKNADSGIPEVEAVCAAIGEDKEGEL